MGVIPIVNENDTLAVAVSPLSFRCLLAHAGREPKEKTYAKRLF